MSNGAAGARSAGGWANRTTRRKAQDVWQPSLLEAGNEFGWGANGWVNGAIGTGWFKRKSITDLSFPSSLSSLHSALNILCAAPSSFHRFFFLSYKPYRTKPIKVETPKNAIVGTAKAKRVILPDNPDAAKVMSCVDKDFCCVALTISSSLYATRPKSYIQFLLSIGIAWLLSRILFTFESVPVASTQGEDESRTQENQRIDVLQFGKQKESQVHHFERNQGKALKNS